MYKGTSVARGISLDNELSHSRTRLYVSSISYLIISITRLFSLRPNPLCSLEITTLGIMAYMPGVYLALNQTSSISFSGTRNINYSISFLLISVDPSNPSYNRYHTGSGGFPTAPLISKH